MFGTRMIFAALWKKHSSSLIVSAAALLVLCFQITGCGGATMQTSMPPTPAVTPLAAVSFCGSTAAGCTPSMTFSLASMRDLNVQVSWQNVTQGTHAQTVHVFLPDGNLFQSMETSFAIPPGPDPAVVNIGSANTEQSLPVAGTFIMQRGLTGAWKVTVDLDGQPMSTQTVQFTQ